MPDENGVEVDAPGGWKAKINGPNVIIFLFVIMVTVGITYLIDLTYKQNVVLGLLASNQSMLIATQKEHIEDQQKMLQAVSLIVDQARDYQNGVIYVLSLSTEQRQQLRLEMPDSVRKLERR